MTFFCFGLSCICLLQGVSVRVCVRAREKPPTAAALSHIPLGVLEKVSQLVEKHIALSQRSGLRRLKRRHEVLAAARPREVESLALRAVEKTQVTLEAQRDGSLTHRRVGYGTSTDDGLRKERRRGGRGCGGLKGKERKKVTHVSASAGSRLVLVQPQGTLWFEVLNHD